MHLYILFMMLVHSHSSFLYRIRVTLFIQKKRNKEVYVAYIYSLHVSYQRSMAFYDAFV